MSSMRHPTVTLCFHADSIFIKEFLEFMCVMRMECKKDVHFWGFILTLLLSVILQCHPCAIRMVKRSPVIIKVFVLSIYTLVWESSHGWICFGSHWIIAFVFVTLSVCHPCARRYYSSGQFNCIFQDIFHIPKLVHNVGHPRVINHYTG